MKIERRPSAALLPAPVVLVTVATDDGRANLLTIAWAGTVCSTPPMLSIAVRPTRYSYLPLATAREFVVNVPRADQIEKVDLAGVLSGAEYDKFQETGFTPAPASVVRPPLVQECPINLECQVQHQLSLGTHDLFIAEVVAVHYDEELLDAHGRVKTGELQPLAYMEGEYWSMGQRLAPYGGAHETAPRNR
jgi:flavin reductase (DIM6/NTAB) family NADH-FMN oxidoreductase RutF